MAKPMTGPSQIANAIANKDNRPRYDYRVPDDVVEAAAEDGSFLDIRVVTVRILTPGEERNAIKRAGQDIARIAYELSQACLVEVKIGEDPGEVRSVVGRASDALEVFNKSHPKVQDLLLGAYHDLHKAKEEEQRSFLASRQIRIG